MLKISQKITKIIILMAVIRLTATFVFFPLIAKAADSPYAEGALVKGSTPQVYLITNGLKRWITDEKTFNNLQFDWQRINVASDDILNQYPTGPEIKNINSYPDGVLIKGSTPEVYLMQGNKRRWIPDEVTFKVLNLNWQSIYTISDEKLEPISRGIKITPLTYTPSRPETILTKTPNQAIEKTNIRFEFGAKSDNPSQITFETYLTGLDKDWQNNGSRQYREFTLPSQNADYTFFVRARDQDGNIDPTPARYQFNLKISPFYQQVKINGANVRSSDYKNETVEIYNRANYSINVTGWTIGSEKKNDRYGLTPSYQIPAYASLDFVANLDLNSGDRITLFTKASPLGYSRTTKAPYGYKLNKCAGYLNQKYQFQPALANQCPAIELTIEEENTLSNDCQNLIKKLTNCRLPTTQETNSSTPSCQEFLRQRVKYDSCVDYHRFDTDFYKNQWQLYLGMVSEAWRNSNDAIILRDASGLVVDRYEY